MTASIDWSIAESDEEWQQYNPTEALADPKSGVIVGVANVPVKLASVFTEIKEKKVLPVNCSCPRVGGSVRAISPAQQQVSINNESERPDENVEVDQRGLVDTRYNLAV